MKESIIMHCDINHCFAQIEEMMFPELKKVPMAVAGSEAKRNGIILARNQKARSFGIKTAMTIREALHLCPKLHIVPPHYDWYRYYSEKVKDIYREYSDLVEDFGIDEAWIDLTHSTHLFGSAKAIATEIQERVYEELGLTISIGVSYNKIFAKLGSDLKKPKGLVFIPKDKVEDIIYPLPVKMLLMVGDATEKKLKKMKIHSIGDLATASLSQLEKNLGKHGKMIWNFANGSDQSTVAHYNDRQEIKSIGNGITTVKNIENIQDLKLVFQILADSIASRAQEHNLVGKTIQISLRNTDLKTLSKQKTLTYASNNSTWIYKESLSLVDQLIHPPFPLRSVSIKLTNLSTELDFIQLDFFEQNKQENNNKRIDETVDEIREKYGFNSIKRCSSLLDLEFTDFNPKEKHTILPVSYL